MSPVCVAWRGDWDGFALECRADFEALMAEADLDHNGQ